MTGDEGPFEHAFPCFSHRRYISVNRGVREHLRTHAEEVSCVCGCSGSAWPVAVLEIPLELADRGTGEAATPVPHGRRSDRRRRRRSSGRGNTMPQRPLGATLRAAPRAPGGSCGSRPSTAPSRGTGGSCARLGSMPIGNVPGSSTGGFDSGSEGAVGRPRRRPLPSAWRGTRPSPKPVVSHSRSGVVSTASSSISRSIARRGDTGRR